jgi:hypothetical protein
MIHSGMIASTLQGRAQRTYVTGVFPADSSGGSMPPPIWLR